MKVNPRISLNRQSNKPKILYVENDKVELITKLKGCCSVSDVEDIVRGTEFEDFVEFQYNLYNDILEIKDSTNLVIEDLLDLIA